VNDQSLSVNGRGRCEPAALLGGRRVSASDDPYVIAEIGINHNGSLETALRLIEAAAHAGCDCVKFQKRTPELCVPKAMWTRMRETPWGYISYIDYRRKIEFGEREYAAIDEYCKGLGVQWTASVWDVESVAFLASFGVPFVKIPSALIVDDALIEAAGATDASLMLSSGMSTQAQIDRAMRTAERSSDLPVLLAHATSTYPCAKDELNLRMIPALRDRYPDAVIGYSGHETGLATTVAATALGAAFVERHVTLDRSMWGSDQAASVEPQGLGKLVRDIRSVHAALGDGVKRVYESEQTALERLRPATAATSARSA
jgi:N-acetylneuraminate synthase